MSEAPASRENKYRKPSDHHPSMTRPHQDSYATSKRPDPSGKSYPEHKYDSNYTQGSHQQLSTHATDLERRYNNYTERPVKEHVLHSPPTVPHSYTSRGNGVIYLLQLDISLLYADAGEDSCYIIHVVVIDKCIARTTRFYSSMRSKYDTFLNALHCLAADCRQPQPSNCVTQAVDMLRYPVFMLR